MPRGNVSGATRALTAGGSRLDEQHGGELDFSSSDNNFLAPTQRQPEETRRRTALRQSRRLTDEIALRRFLADCDAGAAFWRETRAAAIAGDRTALEASTRAVVRSAMILSKSAKHLEGFGSVIAAVQEQLFT